MYIYLGGEAAVEDKEIVGIFDLDNASWSTHTRNYLSAAEKAGLLTNAAEDIPKSFVVCIDEKVILTQPNTAILVKRLDSQEKTNV
jgi:hypothetical protein